MKHFSILTLVLITLLLSACGARPEATPTISPLDLQGTVAAVALTMVGETQAAIPTVTPLPPTPTITNTVPATVTPLPAPFSNLTLTPAPTSNSGGGDPCINQVMPADLKGDPIKIRVNNTTKVAVSFSIYLNQTTPDSACGYRAYSIEAQQGIAINDLVQGCYSLWAWNPDPKTYFMVTNGTTCMMDSSEPWVFEVSTSSIKLKP